MKTLLAGHRDSAYALLRIAAGFLFFCHGAQKILGLMLREGQNQPELFSLLGLAGLIELVGGVMIAVGFMTGIAAFVSSGQMAVAYFMAHQFGTPGFWPIQNRGELAALYAFLFLFIAMAGAGKWSLDERA